MMYSEFRSLKKYNEIKIIAILNDKNLTLKEKELKLEDTLCFNIVKMYDNDQINIEHLKILRNKLLSIDWLKIDGKTFIIQLLEKIHIESLVDLILLKSLLKLKYLVCYSADYFKNLLVYDFKYYAFTNRIQIRYSSTNYLKFKKNYIDYEIVEKSFAYIVECLKEKEIIKYDSEASIFKLEDFANFCVQESIFLTMQKWPLLIPAKNYDYLNEIYQGGYYIDDNKINLLIDNSKIESDIEINNNVLNNIHKLHNTKYLLVTNNKIIEAIENIEKFLNPEFLNFINNRKYIEDWYACYQYLILVKNNIIEVYFPFILDFRGRMYSGMSFGLNPTSNKLSRALVGFGKIYLNDLYKLYLKKYICASFKINLEDFDKLLNINLDFTDSNNLNELINKYSLKNLIILLDWKENVLKYNYTEISIELDASQSGFQVLSLLSNDYSGMIHTNLIKSENNIDLYKSILINLQEKLKLINPNWNKILNREFIKKVIMTIPYGSTLQGQLEMLVDEFVKQYSLRYLIEFNYIPNIIESEIITDEIIIKNLQDLNNRLTFNSFKTVRVDSIDHLQKLILDDLRKHTFKKILKIINEITCELYPNIIKFTKNLKNLKLTSITTPYYSFSLVYFKIYIEKMTIKTKTYTKTIIDTSETDKRKTAIASIANICQGMGDAFIMHTIINNTNIPLYPIHDALLCKVDDIENIQELVLNSYKFVYDYYLNYADFKDLNIDRSIKYNLDSLEIFKIK